MYNSSKRLDIAGSVLFVLVVILSACNSTGSGGQSSVTPTAVPSSYQWQAPHTGDKVKDAVSASVTILAPKVVQVVFFVSDHNTSSPLCDGKLLDKKWGCNGSVKEIQPRINAGKLDVSFAAFDQNNNIVLQSTVPVIVNYIEPGGLWISPIKGQILKTVVHFSAQAYASFPGDPPVSYVNFTIYSAGSWRIACVAHAPGGGSKKDVFSCNANLFSLDVIPGVVIVSFDVYDSPGDGGYYNMSPHGEHKFTYEPFPA